jgi:hypothetical protein
MMRFRYLVDFHARTSAINLYFTGSNNNLSSAETPRAAFLPGQLQRQNRSIFQDTQK